MAGDDNWIDIGSTDEFSKHAAQARHGAEPRTRGVVQGRKIRRGFECLQPRRRTAGRRPARRRLHHLPLAQLEISPLQRPGRARLRGRPRSRLPGQGRERPRFWSTSAAGSKRNKVPHAPHPLARKVERAPGPLRLAGISTTAMDAANPRFSGSDHLLEHALKAGRTLGAETRMIKLNELKFRACEGYYSKAAQACTWPCSITQMDAKDQMDQVYEAMVHWADAIIISSPIRWGAASSLYFKMAERLNCVQNAVTIRDQVLIRNKVAGFIIVGGQDNIQAVAGQMLGFFAELGLHLSAVSLHRPFARLVARRHGAQCRDRPQFRRACRRRGNARQALSRSRGPSDHAR